MLLQYSMDHFLILHWPCLYASVAWLYHVPVLVIKIMSSTKTEYNPYHSCLAFVQFLGSLTGGTIYIKKFSNKAWTNCSVLYCTDFYKNSLHSSLPAGYKTPHGLKWRGTRCVLCASSMVTACQCVEYQFSPVARHGQRLKLRNSFYWLVTGMVGDDSYCSHQDTTLNHTCWHSQVNTTWSHSD